MRQISTYLFYMRNTQIFIEFKRFAFMFFFCFTANYLANAQPILDSKEIIVKFKSETEAKKHKDFSFLKQAFIHQIFQKNAKNRIYANKIWLIYSVSLSNPDDGSVLDKLQKSDGIEWAHYKQIHELFYTPNDPGVNAQYYLPLIKAFDAWDISMGSNNITIGITDTGIDPNHQDLSGNIAYNYNDPVNGIDDDNDGFIDNYMGWNIADNNYNVIADVDGHGVVVAGLAAAEADNNIGISGVAPNVRYLPVKIMDAQGLLSASYEGIVYAAEHDCQIIICSWGGVLGDAFGQEVIDYVTNDLGVLVVAACGNSRNEDIYFPASYKGVLSVAATNNQDLKWTGSTYNYRVDIAAPGENIYTTAFGNSYGAVWGTSAAAPIVAAAAAILKSLKPNLTPAQIRGRLKTSTDKIDTLAGNHTYECKIGTGRLNIYKAISLSSPFCAEVPLKIIEKDYIEPGENIELTGELINFCANTDSVKITISSLSKHATLENGVFTITEWEAMQHIDLSNYHVVLKFANEGSLDIEIPVKFTFNFGDEEFSQVRVVKSSVSWADLNKFDLKMTIAANGKPAYSNVSPLTGNGFRKLQSEPLLWEAGLVIGNSSSHTVTTLSEYSDFTPTLSKVLYGETGTEEKATSRFSDENSAASLGLNYKVEASTGNVYPLSKCILYKVTAVNNTSQTIDNIYIGMFANWIISSGGFISFDPALNMAKITGDSNYPMAHGLAIINEVSSVNNYSFDTGDKPAGININDDFTREEHWQSLTAMREMEKPLENSTPAHLLSAGFFSIKSGDSVSVTFAFLTDSHIQQLEEYVSEIKNMLSTAENNAVSNFLVYPNPVSETFTVYGFTNNAVIYNLSGDIITQWETTNTKVVNTTNWAEGIYILRAETDNAVVVKKIIVLKQ